MSGLTWKGMPMLNRLVAGVAVAAAAVLMAIPATPASAGTADAPSCTARYTCMYQAANYGGSEQDYHNPDQGDSWINLPTSGRAAVISGGASDLWFWNENAGLYLCVPGHSSNADLSFPGGFGDPGWVYIDYGVTANCAEGAPAGAPGS